MSLVVWLFRFNNACFRQKKHVFLLRLHNDSFIHTAVSLPGALKPVATCLKWPLSRLSVLSLPIE